MTSAACRTRVAFFISLFLCSSVSVAAVPDRPFGADDINRVREVSDPQIAPDGAWVAYTVTYADVDRDEETSDLWMVPWAGGPEVQLTHTPESEDQPLWSPDGRWLAFISDRGSEDGSAQVWLLDRSGGEARQLTHMQAAVSDYAWSPDASRLVLVSNHGGAPPADKKKPKPIVIDRFSFMEDGTGYLTDARPHLFLVEIAGGKPVLLSQGEFDHIKPVWSPDGASIAYVTKRGADPDRHYNWDVYLIEARPGAESRQLTTNPGNDCDPEWGYGTPPAFSPDGKSVAYMHGGDPALGWFGVLQLGIVRVDGGDVNLPTATLDRNVVGPRYSADGRHLYFLVEDDRSVQLARIPSAGGRIERLTGTGRVVYDFDIGPRGRIAVLETGDEQPNEIAALENGRLRRLTHQNDNWLSGIRLAQTTEIEYPSTVDRTPVHALLVKPADFKQGRRYPTILRLHGGPVSQYQHEFDEELQLYAASGYVVVAPNYRGSSGRGEDWQKAILGDWGRLEVQDTVAAIDTLVDAGISDPDRLAVGGWSYGGILTNYVIASDTRFKAAVSGAGSSNMLAGYGTDMYVRDWELELGLPWQSLDRWLKVSYPFIHADRIRTPTLFMGGALDFNVPIIHSEQMYQALKRLDVPTQLVVYPDAYHELDRPSFWKDRLVRFLGWFDKYAIGR